MNVINLFTDSRKTTIQEPEPQVNEVGDQLENVRINNAQDISERLQMESVLGMHCYIRLMITILL